jgi:hypothetical protein
MSVSNLLYPLFAKSSKTRTPFIKGGEKDSIPSGCIVFDLIIIGLPYSATAKTT